MASPGKKAQKKGDDSDEETTGPVSDSRLLYSPLETRGWLTLKEGYLLKTKIKTMRKSTKLRWFVLKQHPASLASRLEYYEGMSMRGAVSLESARIVPNKDGVFLVETPNRTFILQAEKGKLSSATAWVLALQQAIVSQARGTKTGHTADAGAVPAPATKESISFTEIEDLSGRGRGTHSAELDGNAIDAARWAALRKTMAAGVDVQPDSEDEDIIALRQAEEEEERRQEEERRVWLESVEAAKAAESASALSASAPEAEPVEAKGDVSEEEDYEELMRQAEEQEERRQREEREAYLATKGSS